MDTTFVDIGEVTETTTRKSTKIAIFITELILFKSASIAVHFYDENNGSVFRVENLKLEGDDYANWSSDDKYVETFVLNKLNLTPAQII